MGRGRCFSIPKDEISLLEIRSKIERQGVLRGEKREFLSFFCGMYGWKKREHEVFRKEETHAP